MFENLNLDLCQRIKSGFDLAHTQYVMRYNAQQKLTSRFSIFNKATPDERRLALSLRRQLRQASLATVLDILIAHFNETDTLDCHSFSYQLLHQLSSIEELNILDLRNPKAASKDLVKTLRQWQKELQPSLPHSRSLPLMTCVG